MKFVEQPDSVADRTSDALSESSHPRSHRPVWQKEHESWLLFIDTVVSNLGLLETISRNMRNTGYDTILDAILTRARKPTRVSLIYRTETTTEKWKTEKVKSKNGYAQK